MEGLTNPPLSLCRPAALGIPVIVPSAFRVKPVGRLPEIIEKVYGGVLAVATRAAA